MSVSQLLSQFFARQEDRAREYTQWHEDFKRMIDTKSEAAFLESIPKRTQAFSQMSQDVIKIEQTLQQYEDEESAAESARLIRVVQLGERSKLQVTIQIQSLRKAHEFDEHNTQQLLPSDPDDSVSLVIAPEARFQSQMKIHLKELDSAIGQINDALDELRCIKQECNEHLSSRCNR